MDAKKLEETLERFLPKEKLMDPADIEPTEADADEETDSGDVLPEWLYETEGISPAEGVRNCGTPEGFLSALQTFYETLPEKADEIETAYVMEDWQFYTIKVHALKSAARIIGANDLSKEAERLEEAGKANDLATIRKESAALLLDYRAYLDRLSLLHEEEKQKEDASPEMLSEAYEALSEFVPAEDYDSVEMVLDSLKEYRLPPEEEDRFRRMRIQLKQLEWEKLADLLKRE